MTGRACRSGEFLAWIADSRQPCITDHSQALVAGEALQKLWQAGAGVVLVEGQPLADRLETAQQLPAVACVFTGNDIHSAEQSLCPRREVAEMANRCPHQIEGSGHRFLALLR